MRIGTEFLCVELLGAGGLGSLERVTRAERFSEMQTLGVQHRQPGEQLGIEAVGLGVLGE